MGLTDNTLIIFTSDNGSPGRDGENMVGEYNSVRKYGLNPSYIYRGTKTDVWEGGHRVPFIARWLRTIKPGSVSTETICLTDLMATCAHIIEEDLPDNAGEDSYSMLPVLKGTEYYGKFREATVHHSNNGDFAIRQGEWKLIMCPGSGGLSRPRNEDSEDEGLPVYQLYNLLRDPAEENNLFTEYPDIAIKLRQTLNEYIGNGRSTPGTKQEDNIELNAMTIANIEGDQQEMDWTNGIPGTRIDHPTIAKINFKSEYKVFAIFP